MSFVEPEDWAVATELQSVPLPPHLLANPTHFFFRVLFCFVVLELRVIRLTSFNSPLPLLLTLCIYLGEERR